jgi:hypothetical protein
MVGQILQHPCHESLKLGSQYSKNKDPRDISGSRRTIQALIKLEVVRLVLHMSLYVSCLISKSSYICKQAIRRNISYGAKA